jgi:VanZ family protein
MRERAGLTKFRKPALAAWGLAMGAVTVLALLPIEHLQMPVFDWWDKAQHALAFVVLTGWASLLWPHAAMRVALGMLAYGAGLEVAQWAVGWRFAEWADLAADAVGVFVAWGLVGWLRSQKSMGIESRSR